MKFIFLTFFSTLICLSAQITKFYVAAVPVIDNKPINSSANTQHCDTLRCDDEKTDNLICTVSESGSIASFHSECGVNLINCYQRAYNASQYQIISRKACAHKDYLYMRGKCDKLKCENGQPEKAVCATNGSGTGLFKSACHIEILNCYQKIYARPQYRVVASKNCAKIQGWH
uniref:CSON014382 protein n=1 Tax=Culicoides sonorensis TaxID=179676 RepID=A0A336KRG8_CULSO